MKIDHIGYLTRDIAKSIEIFKQLGFTQESGVISDHEVENTECGALPRNVYLCFLTNGAYRVELVSPMNQDSVVANMLIRQGDGPYHICYQIGSIQEKTEELKNLGWVVVSKPTEAVAFNGDKVAFLYKKNVGFIELREVQADGKGK